MEPQSDTKPHWHAAVRMFADRQHGVVTREQLIRAGVSSSAIRHQRKLGRFVDLHAGVYAVGHSSRILMQREMAAALASGTRTAVISHESAAHLWQILPRSINTSPSNEVHVSITRGDTRRKGIATHRVAPIFPVDRRRIEGIPVTGPARTLLDLAGGDAVKFLARAVNQARVMDLVSPDDLEKVIERYPRAPGVSALRAQMEDREYSRSKAEDLMSALVTRYEFPIPLKNARLLGHEVDFLWPEHELIAEVNGFKFHSTRHTFDKDHSKIAALRLAGYDVIEVTWNQLTKKPDVVADLIRDGLARHSKRQAAA